MRPVIVRNWEQTTNGDIVTDPHPPAASAYLAEADMWVFSLLTSPYVGCGHICASAFELNPASGDAVYGTINGKQFFSASLAAGCESVRFCVRRTYSGSGTCVTLHVASSDYDYAQTGQITQFASASYGSIITVFDWQTVVTTETSSHVNNSAGSQIDRQLQTRKLKSSQRENFYTSQCTSASLFVGQKISDMTTV